MTANVWEAGKLYPTGSVVQPASAPPPQGAALTNPGFESGDVDYTKDPGWTIVNAPASAFQGSWCGRFLLNGTGKLTSDELVAVAPGKSITASLAVDQGASSSGNAGAQVALAWYDAGSVEIAESLGNLIDSGSDGEYKTSTVTAAAPPGAAFVAVRCVAFGNGSQPVFVDSFVWNYVSSGVGGLIYKAVQPATGTSGATEPVWPTTLGVQVVDNEVIWEAMAGTRVVWEAHPILVSGAVEPTWGLLPDSIVADGSIRWRAFPRVITDENCPHSRVVVIAEGHVFSPDDDVVRFSAALAPRDWTSPDDAGFLNTGLSSIASVACTGLALYRKNLTAWTASGFQLYQMDPDPALMVGIDAMEGIGTVYPKTLVPIADDLFGLTRMGVRSVNVSVSGQNLSAGDVGAPVDPLVRRSLEIAEINEVEPFATFYPALGQYMLAFEGQPVDAVTVTGALGDGDVGETVAFAYDVAGGVGPKTVALASGELDPGLTLNPDGTITGERAGPAGLYEWEVIATDSEGLESAPHADDSETIQPAKEWYVVAAPWGSNAVIARGAGVYCVVDDGQSWVSADAITWTASAPGVVMTNPKQMIYADGKFLVCGSGTRVYTSADGLNWTQSSGAAFDVFNDRHGLAYNAALDLFVMTQNFNWFRSADGVAWTQFADPFTGAGRAVFATPSGFTVIDSTAAEQARSVDGVTWTTHGALPGSPWSYTSGGMMPQDTSDAGVMMSMSGTGVGARTVDGATWEGWSIGAGSNYRALAYGHGEWIALSATSGNDAYVSTDDGDTWAVEPTWAAANTGSVDAVAAFDAEDRFVCIGTNAVILWGYPP